VAPLRNAHLKPVLRSKRDQRLRLDALIRHQVERGALRQAGQHQRRLELGERVADALALSTAEREVRKPGQALRE